MRPGRWARTQWREVGRGTGGRLQGSSWEVGLQVTRAQMLSHMSGVRNPLQEGTGTTDCSASPITHPAGALALRCPTPLPQGKGTRRIHFREEVATSPELSSISSLSLFLPFSSRSSVRRLGALQPSPQQDTCVLEAAMKADLPWLSPLSGNPSHNVAASAAPQVPLAKPHCGAQA